MSNVTQEPALENVEGALYQSLRRNNKEIRSDRADAIAEDLEMTFKRGVEDISVKLKRLERERANMYDFSPTNTQSLVLAKELDSAEILFRDSKISIEIRQLEIELDIAKSRYEFLFGKTI